MINYRLPAIFLLLAPLPAYAADGTVAGILLGLLVTIATTMLLYTARHYWFTLNRLFGVQRHPYIDIDMADWPHITVLVAAHNEEAVIAGALQALLGVDYPAGRMDITPVNDRSSDRTREIIDAITAEANGRIKPFHRSSGKPGKAAALKEVTATLDSEIIVVFDADYLPAKGLIKQLVAPFFDPEVGATMGRVVPQNVGVNLLTRMLDLERSGGYQVDQQARMNLRMVPQYGGTCGAIRMAALDSIGGWHDDVLAEDTDLTYRLLLKNWKTIYQNRSECYEEVPETWNVRIRQIMRWAKGHNQAMWRHLFPLFPIKGLSRIEKFDGAALLGVYLMAPMLIVGWFIAVLLFFIHPTPFLSGVIVLFSLVSFSSLGNFAAFFQIAAASYLDGSRQRIRLLPLNYLGFLVSAISITRATLNQILDNYLKRELIWDKTVRYRKPASS